MAVTADLLAPVEAQIARGLGRATIAALFRVALSPESTTRAKWSLADTEQVRAACAAWWEARPADELEADSGPERAAAFVWREARSPEARRQLVGSAMWADERARPAAGSRAARMRVWLLWLDADTRAERARARG